ncbi:pilus assembly protein CpaD [Sinorhizobium sp. BG8]|nr:pilus assembly protein CpaD [Sinorhizobium sp. BG8]
MPHNGANRLRLALATAVLLSVAALSGCGTNPDGTATGSIPDDYRTRHPIVLSEDQHTLDVPVASGDRQLTMAMRDNIRGFAQDYRSKSRGVIQVMAPSGSYNAGAAAQIRKQIRSTLIAAGVPKTQIIETSYAASAQGDAAPIRLSFVAITAQTNTCGQWPEDLVDNTFQNRNYYNFGCASQSNMAAQIANPMDLVAPRGMTPIDAANRVQVINDYRGTSSDSTTISITTN